MFCIRFFLALVLFVGSTFGDDQLQLRPSKHVPSLKTPSDLTAEIVLQNPLVANPLYIHFDAKGRMWLIEYRQYPWPAGLRLLSRDAVWRNRYEPPFAPPPPHDQDSPFRGRDRISIHEDTNGDGVFDTSKVFLDGLNFATAALPGRGGVFVMNPPYLLFYADENKDDTPDDREPRILLSGFGIEDSHSIANSLRWGPDGWIYATQGSTVSGTIVRHGNDNKPIPGEAPVHSLGQNLWRYHPEKHKYEIFAEGGGNAFGVEIDSVGRVYSGHNGGNTRGFHYIQGGYFQKTFGKHGDLSNPYTYGYFPDMQHHDVKRFTHTFAIYESNELPARYHGSLFGVNPVENYLIQSRIEADGSSRKTTDISTIVEPGNGDRADWFTPVDVQVGPDGALYLADWFSIQSNHYRNHEGETNPELGRVIRVRKKGARLSAEPFDLESLKSDALVDQYLGHHNRWFRHQVLRILGDRKDSSVRDKLLALIRSTNDQLSLDAFWALHLSVGFNGDLIREFLDHKNEHVRRWAVRLCGDDAQLQDTETIDAMARLGKRERSAEVVSQILCSARRMKSEHALKLVCACYSREEFASDIHIPLSLWWAIETHVDGVGFVSRLTGLPNFWAANWRPAGSQISLNLVKRYASKGDDQSLDACAELLRSAPTGQTQNLVQAFLDASKGRSLSQLPTPLVKELAKSTGVVSRILAIRRGDKTATSEALDLLSLPTKKNASDLEQIVVAIGDARSNPARAVPLLVSLVKEAKPNSLKIASLVALQKFDNPEIGMEILTGLMGFDDEVRQTAESTLASRPSWSTALVEAVAADRIQAADLQPETVSRIRLHKGSGLQALVTQHLPDPSLDKAALANRTAALMQVISQGQGQPLSGKELFFTKASCGKCHQLFGAGGEIGPDLTPYNRTDLRNLLLAIVNPSAEIREGYENHTLLTVDGQVITGLLIESNDRVIVLRGVDGQNHVVAIEEIEERSASQHSLMPMGLLDSLTENELRDLFAYLVSTTPPK